MKVFRCAVGAVAVVAWVVLPVVVALVLTARSERSVQSPPITSAWVPAGEVQGELTRTVIASGVLGEAPPLLAPDWTGLVEQVDLRPGEPLRSDDVVAIVNGVPRLAVHTPRPFRRPLGPDDRGPDVAELNAWLAARGNPAGEGDRFGSATRRGVRALREELGVDRAEADSFDPAWIVYLPRPEVTISSIGLQVGAPVPPAGSVVAEVEAQVTSVQLLEPDQSGVAMPAAPPPAAPPPAAPPPADGADTSAPTGPPANGSIPAAPAPAASGSGSSGSGSSGTPLMAAAEGAVLRRQGQALGPVAVDGTIPDETLLALLPFLDGQESVVVQLIEPAPAGARPIPSGALFSGPTGATCVSFRADTGGNRSVIVALPVTQSGDRVVLAGLPDGPLEVEVNPAPATRRRCQG